MIVDSIPVIDVDSHVSEPPELWLDRLPRKWHDIAPRIVNTDTKAGDLWVVGDHTLSPAWGFAPAGHTEPWPSFPRVQSEVDPAAYDPNVRAKRLDEFGIRAQLLYPNLLGLWIRTFLQVGDRDFQLACFRAYNDFISDFAAAEPGRFVPIASVPFFDIDASIAEVERCAANGHKGILLANQPEKAGLPPLNDEYWRPLLSLAEDAGLSVNFHVGFGQVGKEAHESTDAELKVNTFISGGIADVLPAAIGRTVIAIFLSNAGAIADVILSGVCEQYPKLNIVSVESGFGYVPWLLEALDWQWVNYGAQDANPERLLPSEYFRRQIYATFWFEGEVMRRLIDLYPDNLMFETDYPHPTCIAPGPTSHTVTAAELIEENLAGIPEDIVRKVLSGTAARLYDLSTG
ncbi:MAG: amidohydrolase family protein [Acidimicrobiia bacterium]